MCESHAAQSSVDSEEEEEMSEASSMEDSMSSARISDVNETSDYSLADSYDSEIANVHEFENELQKEQQKNIPKATQKKQQESKPVVDSDDTFDEDDEEGDSLKKTESMLESEHDSEMRDVSTPVNNSNKPRVVRSNSPLKRVSQPVDTFFGGNQQLMPSTEQLVETNLEEVLIDDDVDEESSESSAEEESVQQRKHEIPSTKSSRSKGNEGSTMKVSGGRKKRKLTFQEQDLVKLVNSNRKKKLSMKSVNT